MSIKSDQNKGKGVILSKGIDFFHDLCYHNQYKMPVGQFFFGGSMDDGVGNTCHKRSVKY